MNLKRAAGTLRHAVAAALVFAAALAIPGTLVRAETSADYYEAQKFVYHNNGKGEDSGKYFKALLKNFANHLDAVGDSRMDIKVVSHGDGVKLFQNPDAELAKSIDALRVRNVQFLICRNTLTERKIDWKTLHGVKEADLVPSGVAELVRLQQKSYIYVHP